VNPLYEKLILDRNTAKNLTLSPEKLDYVFNYYKEELALHGEKVLYVGVGHGLDLMQAVQEKVVSSAVGVDPYIAGDGNNDTDYNNLLKALAQLG
jgi:hypothetical protein